MTIDSTSYVTSVQYNGYFQSSVRKFYEAGKVAEETREAIFQKRLEEERKRIHPIEEFKGKLVDRLI